MSDTSAYDNSGPPVVIDWTHEESDDCWCGPTVTDYTAEGGTKHIVHRSLDEIMGMPEPAGQA